MHNMHCILGLTLPDLSYDSQRIILSFLVFELSDDKSCYFKKEGFIYICESFGLPVVPAESAVPILSTFHSASSKILYLKKFFGNVGQHS